MKKFLILFILFAFLSPSASFSGSDDDFQRDLIRKRNEQFRSREALRKQREEKEIDYAEMDRELAEQRRKELEHREYLTNNFEQVALQEIAKARRFYDRETVLLLQNEAEKRYKQDPENLLNIYARIYIYLFNCDFLLYRYNTTKLMYERPRLRKQRKEEAEIGIMLVDKLLDKNPEDPELWRLKGIFLSCFLDRRFSKKKYYLQAEAALKKAVQLAEDPTKAKLSLALFYMNQPKRYGRNVKAANLIAKELLESNPRLVDALLIKGRNYQLEYKYSQAYKTFKKALQIEPKNPEVIHFYGIARQDKKRFKKLMKS